MVVRVRRYKFPMLFFFVVFSIMFALSCSKSPSPEKQSGKSSSRPAFDETADARAEILRAMDAARYSGKRILLIFGANWCPWCRSLHELFESDSEIRQICQRHFRVVWIDVGKKDRNLDLNERYGNPLRYGIPVIVVLDADGRKLAVQETGSLEQNTPEKKGHDREKVLNFLRKWIPQNTLS